MKLISSLCSSLGKNESSSDDDVSNGSASDDESDESLDSDSDDDEDDSSSTGVPVSASKMKKGVSKSSDAPTTSPKKKSSMFGFGDPSKLEQFTVDAKKAARGKTATIFLPIEFATKGMSYFPVSLGEQGDMWWFKPEYLLSILEYAYKSAWPSSKFPEYFKTFKHYGIRDKPHGANVYKKIPSGKSVINVITFVVGIPTAQKNKIQSEVDEIIDFIYPCMLEFAQGNDGGKYALDYLESLAWINDDGEKKGIYGALTKKDQHNLRAVELRMQKEMIQFFKIKPDFNHDIHLDNYFTDYDIKTFVETYHGGNSWEEIPKNVRKACYKNKYKVKDLPVWDNIAEMRQY